MMTTSTRFRIDFQVREILPEGSDPSLARYVTFGDEVNFYKVRDFFERCGLGVINLFQTHASGNARGKVLKLMHSPRNKINIIKALRQMTDLGLKDAKHLVEGPLGTPLVVFANDEEVEAGLNVLRRYEAYDVDVINCIEVEDVVYDHAVEAGVPKANIIGLGLGQSGSFQK